MLQQAFAASNLWFRAGLALVVAIAVFLVYLALPALGINSDGAAVLTLLGVLAVLLVGAISIRSAREGDNDDVQGVLIATAPWLPSVLAVTLVALFLLGQTPPIALAAAVVISAVLWLVTGFLLKRYASVDNSQPRNFADLVDRLARLDSDFQTFGSDERIGKLQHAEEREYASASRKELIALLPSMASELGVPKGKPKSGRGYVTGTGYIDLWNRMHRAEEALIAIMPPANVVASTGHDRLRLVGSNIGNSRELVDQLDDAVKKLKASSSTPIDEQILARGELRTIRKAINKYRDDIWDTMLRQRNQLLRTMMLTGITAVGALVLALVAGADRTVVVGASAFYLVGAIIGLFGRLRGEAQTSSVVDDYGLSDARLIVTPLLSGLGALAGVVLTAKILLPTSDVVAPAAVDDTGKVTIVASDVRQPASLHDIFDIDLNPAGLLVAAVFGLSPGLALDRLLSQAEKYKTDLQVSSADSKKT